jgi:hypothetical protein
MREAKLKTTVFAILAFLSFAVLIPRSASASNLLTNGDFENEPFWNNGTSGDGNYTALTGTELPGWTIASGHDVTIHIVNGYYGYPTISGNYSVNTDGEGHNGHNCDISQDFATSAGQKYNLQFDWKNWFYWNNTDQLEVSVVDTVTQTTLYDGKFAVTNSTDLYHVLTSFIGTGDTLRLEIQENPESGFNDNSFIVDNFSVDTAPVPAPVPLLLLGSGLLGLAGLRKKIKK